nr:NAD(P)-dependent oxidoreductase [Ramlibacter aurantiacus]
MLAPLSPQLPELLRAAGYEVIEPGQAGAERAEAAVTRGSLACGELQFAAMPRLRLLCCWGAGRDAIDLHAAARHGVAVAHAPGANASSVADLAIGFLIALRRQLPLADRHVRSGQWQDPTRRLPASPGLTGARLGLFGFGEVGRRVALRAQALEMEVGACSRRAPAMAGVQPFRDLLSLARWAEVLVLAAPVTADTRHAVDEAVIQALGPDGMLVNVARGALVDEAALCRALSGGRLAGFASDVFEHEPAVPQALRDFPNALLSPHIGGATRAAEIAQERTVLANLQAFFETGTPRHPVRTA